MHMCTGLAQMAEGSSGTPKARYHYSKRSRESPTGTTPRQEEKKQKNVPRRRLSYTALEQQLETLHIDDPSALDACLPMETSREVSVVPEHAETLTYTQWTVEENKALVEFMLFNNPKKWTSTKDQKFWKAAATFMRDKAQETQVRTGK